MYTQPTASQADWAAAASVARTREEHCRLLCAPRPRVPPTTVILFSSWLTQVWSLRYAGPRAPVVVTCLQ